MPIENERKLILDPHSSTVLKDSMDDRSWAGFTSLTEIIQSYLCDHARIRQIRSVKTGSACWVFTYKQMVGEQLVEIETAITREDYQKLQTTNVAQLFKLRGKAIVDGLWWDIDWFLHPRSHEIYLAMAEVEMPEHQTQLPEIPHWLKPHALMWVPKNDPRFINKNLVNPDQVSESLRELINSDAQTS